MNLLNKMKWFHANEEMLNTHHWVYNMKHGDVAIPRKSTSKRVTIKSIEEWTQMNTPVSKT